MKVKVKECINAVRTSQGLSEGGRWRTCAANLRRKSILPFFTAKKYPRRRNVTTPMVGLKKKPNDIRKKKKKKKISPEMVSSRYVAGNVEEEAQRNKSLNGFSFGFYAAGLQDTATSSQQQKKNKKTRSTLSVQQAHCMRWTIKRLRLLLQLLLLQRCYNCSSSPFTLHLSSSAVPAAVAIITAIINTICYRCCCC